MGSLQTRQPGSAVRGESPPPSRGGWGALVTVVLSSAVTLADFMAVSVALPAMQRSTGVNFTELQWVLEAYVVAFAGFVMVSGYLSGRFGWRPTLLVGLGLFAASAAVAGSVTSRDLFVILLLARAAQGAGAGLVAPTGTIVLTETFANAGKAVGAPGRAPLAVFSGATALAVALSPLAGGLLEAELGWRSVFLAEAAGAAGALVVAAVGTGALAKAGWRRPLAERATAPALALFGRRTVVGACAGAFGVSMAVLGPFLLLALYFSNDLGYGALGTGLRLLALSAATLPVAVICVPLSRYLPTKLFVSGGLALVAVGLFAASRLSAGSGWVTVAPGLVVAGVGLELVNPRLGEAAASSVEPQLAPAAYRATSTFRQLGVAAGVVVSASVFAARLIDAMAHHLPKALSAKQASLAGLVLRGRLDQLARLAGRGVVRTAFASAMRDALEVAAAAAAISAVLSLVMRSTRPASPAAGPIAPASRERAAVAGLFVSPAGPIAASSGVRGAGTGLLGNGPIVDGAGQPLAAGDREQASPQPSPLPARALARRPPGAEARAPAGERAGASERRYTLKGLVRSASGNSVEGATVTLVGARGERYANGESASDGSFTLNAGGSGIYTLVVSAPGYRAGTKVVDVGPGGARADFVLFGVGSIEGRVSSARDSSPLEAEVELRPPGRQALIRYRTGAEGRFSFGHVLEGNYELVASAAGHKAGCAGVLVTQGSCAGAEIALLGVGHIYGAVCSPDGAWLPAAPVELASPEGEVVGATTTDDAGSYHFDEVPEGVWLLSASGGEPLRAEVAPGRATQVDLAVQTTR